jgi:hypothetical protein
MSENGTQKKEGRFNKVKRTTLKMDNKKLHLKIKVKGKKIDRKVRSAPDDVNFTLLEL